MLVDRAQPESSLATQALARHLRMVNRLVDPLEEILENAQLFESPQEARACSADLGSKMDAWAAEIDRLVTAGADPCDEEVERAFANTLALCVPGVARLVTPLFRSAAPRVWAFAGTPLLHWAATAEAVRVLVEAGSPLEDTDAEGYTALHRAVEQRNPAIWEFLLGAGANPNCRNGLGTPVLHAAVIAGPDCRDRLLDAGADPTARDARGCWADQGMPLMNPSLVQNHRLVLAEARLASALPPAHQKPRMHRL